MVFSDSSTKTGIVEDIDFLCGTDATSYSLEDKARNVNRHYYKAVIDVLKSSGKWQFDDSNLTTLPTITTTLVAGQKDYQLPSNVLKIDAVEVLNSNGDAYTLTPIDTSEMGTSITDFEETDGLPRFYDLVGDSVILYQAPSATDVTLTAGLILHIQREFDLFTPSDTTQEPGLPEPFHRILSLGGSYDWLCVNGTHDRADRVLQQYEQLRGELREFTGDKNRNTKTRFQPLRTTRDYI